MLTEQVRTFVLSRKPSTRLEPNLQEDSQHPLAAGEHGSSRPLLVVAIFDGGCFRTEAEGALDWVVGVWERAAGVFAEGRAQGRRRPERVA